MNIDLQKKGPIMIFYHSLKNKYPSGAVTDNQTIFIQVKVTKETRLSSIQLVLKEDLTQTTSIYHPSRSTIEADATLFSFEISPLHSGLYFYYFEVRSEIGTYFLSNHEFHAVPVLNYHEINSWQLTVYEEQFTTPEWFKGGIMYQIFPDRFKKSDKYKAKKQPTKRFVTVMMTGTNCLNRVSHMKITKLRISILGI